MKRSLDHSSVISNRGRLTCLLFFLAIAVALSGCGGSGDATRPEDAMKAIDEANAQMRKMQEENLRRIETARQAATERAEKRKKEEEEQRRRVAAMREAAAEQRRSAAAPPSPKATGWYLQGSRDEFIPIIQQSEIYATLIRSRYTTVLDLASQSKIQYFSEAQLNQSSRAEKVFNGIVLKGAHTSEIRVYELDLRSMKSSESLFENSGPAISGESLWIVGDRLPLKISKDGDLTKIEVKPAWSRVHMLQVGSKFGIFSVGNHSYKRDKEAQQLAQAKEAAEDLLILAGEVDLERSRATARLTMGTSNIEDFGIDTMLATWAPVTKRLVKKSEFMGEEWLLSRPATSTSGRYYAPRELHSYPRSYPGYNYTRLIDRLTGKRVGKGNFWQRSILIAPDESGFLFTMDYDELHADAGQIERSGSPAAKVAVKCKRDMMAFHSFAENTDRAIPTESKSLKNGLLVSFTHFGHFVFEAEGALTCYDLSTGRIVKTFGPTIGHEFEYERGRKARFNAAPGTYNISETFLAVKHGKQVRTFDIVDISVTELRRVMVDMGLPTKSFDAQLASVKDTFHRTQTQRWEREKLGKGSKDEFETTDVYTKRLRGRKAKLAAYEESMRAELRLSYLPALRSLYRKHARGVHDAVHASIQNCVLTDYELTPYNADGQEFGLIASSDTHKYGGVLPVPIEAARKFKAEHRDWKTHGVLMKAPSGELRLLQVVFSNPRTSVKYRSRPTYRRKGR